MKAVKIILWSLVALWAGVIFYLSAQTAGESSDLSGSLIWQICEKFYRAFLEMSLEEKTEFVSSLQNLVRILAHICEYGMLGILLRSAFIPYNFPHKIVLPSFFCLLYAISDEIHQFFVPGRAYQFSDILCDTLGGVLGVIFVSIICIICRKIKAKNSKKGLHLQ